MLGDLADDVRRGAEAVQPQALGVAGQTQRAVADQPGAEKRRGLQIGESVRDREAEAMVGHSELGEAAVDVVTREARVVAEVLAAAGAVAALTVRPAQPGNADAVANGEALSAGPEPDHNPGDLVPQNERQLGLGQIAVDDVQVGAADAAGVDLDQDLLRPGNGFGDIDQLERLALGFEDHRAH